MKILESRWSGHRKVIQLDARMSLVPIVKLVEGEEVDRNLVNRQLSREANMLLNRLEGNVTNLVFEPYKITLHAHPENAMIVDRLLQLAFFHDHARNNLPIGEVESEIWRTFTLHSSLTRNVKELALIKGIDLVRDVLESNLLLEAGKILVPDILALQGVVSLTLKKRELKVYIARPFDHRWVRESISRCLDYFNVNCLSSSA